MRVLITGGTGFLGRSLCARLAQEGHGVTVVTRSIGSTDETLAANKKIFLLQGNPMEPGDWQEAIKNQNVLINLAGASIFSKWSDRQKRRIRESRLRTTRRIVEGIDGGKARPVTLINASAIGYYGFHQDEELDEKSPPGGDFLAGVCRDWEAEALRAADKGARVVLMRSGIVLGEKGGALGIMVRFFKLFIGGPLGSGRQWFSWIHLRDWVRAIVFLIDQPEISGPVNLCTPNPVRNKELARALGKALHRTAFMPAPAFAVRLILGEFGNLVLKGQRVVPRRLLDRKFDFQYPEIEGALEDILAKK